MVYVAIYVICASFVIFVLGTYTREWKKNTDGKNNLIYSKDGLRVTYVYFVPHTKEQITEILSHKNAGDRLCYVFDSDSMVIKFASPEEEYYNMEFSGDDYHLSFEEQGNSCLLYVEKISLFTPNEGSVPLFMNAFWKVKVNASVYQI